MIDSCDVKNFCKKKRWRGRAEGPQRQEWGKLSHVAHPRRRGCSSSSTGPGRQTQATASFRSGAPSARPHFGHVVDGGVTRPFLAAPTCISEAPAQLHQNGCVCVCVRFVGSDFRKRRETPAWPPPRTCPHLGHTRRLPPRGVGGA